jgi:hypothetical protein
MTKEAPTGDPSLEKFERDYEARWHLPATPSDLFFWLSDAASILQSNGSTTHAESVKSARDILKWLQDNWHPTHQHWDPKGTSGTNCLACQRDSEARSALLNAIRAKSL